MENGARILKMTGQIVTTVPFPPKIFGLDTHFLFKGDQLSSQTEYLFVMLFFAWCANLKWFSTSSPNCIILYFSLPSSFSVLVKIAA